MIYLNGKEIFSFGIGGGSNSALPIEISTEAEMNALLNTATIGSVYKYVGESTATYENGALYIVEVALINFAIGSAVYQAEKGMTWEEWVGSKYNVEGFIIVEASIYSSSRGKVVQDNGSNVLALFEIVENKAYDLKVISGSGSGSGSN